MRTKITATIALALLFSACEREMDISKVTFKQRLVVNALLNDKDAVAISVSQSTDVKDNTKPGPITNANVLITDSKKQIIACSYNPATLKYESSSVLKAGETYELSVTANGFTKAYSKLIIPSVATGGSASWRDSTGKNNQGYFTGTLSVKILDNGAERNYYRINLYYYDSPVAEWKTLTPETVDAQLQNSAIKTEDGGWILTDVNFNGKSKEIGFVTPFGYVTQNQTPKFLVIIENLSGDYYSYFKSLENYAVGTGVFVEAVPVYSNITNGIGIFAASSIQRDTIK